MHFYLDRSLPIPVGVQLRGQIEYGIACGEIERGGQLPSVRELSSTLGIAPATVSQVYKELLQEGLIETLAGKGTYVIDTAELPGRDFTAMHQHLGLCDVGDIANAADERVHQTRGAIDADMGFQAEMSVLALLGLVHFRITFPALVLRRR